MDPEGLLLCSQDPTAGLYLVTDEPVPCIPIQFSKDEF